MSVWWLSACVASRPATTVSDDTTSAPSSPETTQPPAPPPPLACSVIPDTRSVLVISRADPAIAAVPTLPPDPLGPAHGFAGPDALGRVYLLESEHVLLRSDDDGCTWQRLGDFREYVELLTSSSTERLYAHVDRGGNDGELQVSDDGGETFTIVGHDTPERLVSAEGDAELRAEDRVSLLASSDGGASWLPLTEFPADPGLVRIDPADFHHAAFVSQNGKTQVWHFDGFDWQYEVPDRDAQLGLVALREGVVALSTESSFLHSVTGKLPFAEFAWDRHEDDDLHDLAVVGPLVVAAGRNAPPGSDYSVRSIFVIVTDGVTQHRYDMLGYDDIAGIAITESSIIVGIQSTLDIEWW